MLGMSEYQLDLMFEYIGLQSSSDYPSRLPRMAEIRKLLLDDARANEERLDKISESLSRMQIDNEIRYGRC